MFAKHRLSFDYYISSYAWWALADETSYKHALPYFSLRKRDEELVIWETGGFND